MHHRRGIGWSWGIKGKRIPARHPSQNFLSSLVKRLFIFHLLTVLPYAYLQFYREFSLDSAAILRTNFRFAHSGPGDFISSAIVLLGRLSRVVALGMAICGSIELQFTYLTLFVYAFTAFWRVIIPESSNGIFGYMRPDPFRIEAWPSPTVRPWMASSITELWGNRWHPFFRRTFVAVGGRPLIAIANRLGFTSQIAISICAAIGAFLLSGFIHEHSKLAFTSVCQK